MGNGEKELMPIGKGIIASVIVIIVIAVLVVVMSMLKLPMWIPFIGLTMWAMTGMSMKFKDILKLWLSIAVGLLIGYCTANLDKGLLPIIAGIVGVCLLIFGMTTGRWSFVFNSYTAVITCVCSAVTIDPVSTAMSTLFGFAVIGLLPFGLVKLLSSKKKETEVK